MVAKKSPAKKAVKKVAKKAKVAKSVENGEFAVILTGGKQYRVSAGDTLMIEKLPGEYKVGDAVIFDKVLLVDGAEGCTIGNPYIDGAKVQAEFNLNGRSQKVRVVKYKAKSRYLKQNGHRQPFTKVTITAIK